MISVVSKTDFQYWAVNCPEVRADEQDPAKYVRV